MLGTFKKLALDLTVVLSSLVAVTHLAAGSTLCVDAKRSGCHTTIGAAVAHAAPGDVITVAHGTYREDVVISKSLSLVGENAANTIIDGSGLANAVFINGLLVSRLTGVTIQGFTLTNARYEGLLIANASHVVVRDNRITNNDQALDVKNLACPGLPEFETAEDFDCGEGVHLTGVTDSAIVNNTIEHNSGGILISDETGPTYDNLIAQNLVENNLYDCGITIPSHPPAPSSGRTFPPFGIYRNQISDNESSGNGVLGGGAGVGLFGFLPGARVSENVIKGNRITGNGLPGVAMHGHSGLENLNNNRIIGNYIAGNGADTEDAETPGPAGINIASAGAISGTEILNNVIKNEAVDIAVKTTAAVIAHDNNLNGPAIGVANLGTGQVNASENWWGCSQGPNTPGCSTVTANVLFTPWLSSPAVPNGSPKSQH